MYAAKIQHNTCKVYDAKSGSLKRTFCSGKAESDNISDAEVAVARSDGKARVYDIDDGHLIRTL
jgi:hypothetical protein